MTAREAAEYCGLSVPSFHTWRRKWQSDCKLSGKYRYAKDAIDIAIDKAIGVQAASKQPALSSYQRMKAREHANQTRSHK